jgi:hypothetical protein
MEINQSTDTDAPLDIRPGADFEACCTACGEVFCPNDADDTEHFMKGDGTLCGGEGHLTRVIYRAAGEIVDLPAPTLRINDAEVTSLVRTVTSRHLMDCDWD